MFCRVALIRSLQKVSSAEFGITFLDISLGIAFLVSFIS